MMEPNNIGGQTEELLKKASEKLGVDAENLKKAAQSGNVNQLLKSLGTAQAQKIEKLLSDKEAASKLLSTPKAQQLLKKFLGEN